MPAVLSEGGDKDGPTGYCVGLGHVAASGSGSWDATARLVENAVPMTPIYKPEEKPRDLYGLLIGEASVPVKGLFVLVLLFTVGIGPVNIWILSKYRRRIWLWWNVPAVSLLTCLAVFCYALFSEGWIPQGKVASMTVLDEHSHRATTIGVLSYYCPLTPSGGLRFGVDTDVALLGSEPSQSYSYRPYRSRSELAGLRFVDWTVDQQLTSGWVTARVPAYFQTRKSEDRRERLLVRKDAKGNLSVTNALGADIRQLFLADASGHVFHASDVAAGREAALGLPCRVPTPPDHGQADLRTLFLGTSNWPGAFRTTVSARPESSHVCRRAFGPRQLCCCAGQFAIYGDAAPECTVRKTPP